MTVFRGYSSFCFIFLISCFRFFKHHRHLVGLNLLQIGSFGAITRIVNIVPNREKLLRLAAAGPLAGFSLGILLLLAGFILPPNDGIGIIINPDIFHESFLAGGIGIDILSLFWFFIELDDLRFYRL